MESGRNDCVSDTILVFQQGSMEAYGESKNSAGGICPIYSVVGFDLDLLLYTDILESRAPLTKTRLLLKN